MPKKTYLIIIEGQNGAGKSTVSKLVHKQLPRSVLLSFDTFKRLFSDFDRQAEYFSLTDKAMKGLTRLYLNAGVHVIIDKFAPQAKFIAPYERLAKSRKNQVVFKLYQLEADFNVRYARVRARPLPVGVKTRMDKLWLAKNDAAYAAGKYKKARVIDTTKSTPQKIARIIYGDLKS